MTVSLPEFLNQPMPEGKVKDLVDKHLQEATKRDYEWFRFCGGIDVVISNILQYGEGHELGVAKALATLYIDANQNDAHKYYVCFRDVINKFTPDDFGRLSLPSDG